MVCVKTPESTHNFLNDAIDFYEEDGYLYAKNTTLGADNGIGIALAMTAIDFESHPKMELVFTIDEEDGMTGVEGLDFSLLS
ncbi:MAG TPA: cytosol nonspecific dipeptidase, partial [Ignavibacteriaceae bacterium]